MRAALPRKNARRTRTPRSSRSQSARAARPWPSVETSVMPFAAPSAQPICWRFTSAVLSPFFSCPVSSSAPTLIRPGLRHFFDAPSSPCTANFRTSSRFRFPSSAPILARAAAFVGLVCLAHRHDHGAAALSRITHPTSRISPAQRLNGGCRTRQQAGKQRRSPCGPLIVAGSPIIGRKPGRTDAGRPRRFHTAGVGSARQLPGCPRGHPGRTGQSRPRPCTGVRTRHASHAILNGPLL